MLGPSVETLLQRSLHSTSSLPLDIQQLDSCNVDRNALDVDPGNGK